MAINKPIANMTQNPSTGRGSRRSSLSHLLIIEATCNGYDVFRVDCPSHSDEFIADRFRGAVMGTPGLILALNPIMGRRHAFNVIRVPQVVGICGIHDAARRLNTRRKRVFRILCHVLDLRCIHGLNIMDADLFVNRANGD